MHRNWCSFKIFMSPYCAIVHFPHCALIDAAFWANCIANSTQKWIILTGLSSLCISQRVISSLPDKGASQMLRGIHAFLSFQHSLWDNKVLLLKYPRISVIILLTCMFVANTCTLRFPNNRAIFFRNAHGRLQAYLLTSNNRSLWENLKPW